MKPQGKMVTTFKVTKEQVKRIDTNQAMYLKPGTVLLVRSQNVTDLGDHYIIVTGGLIAKPHGIRPQTEVMHIPMGDAMSKFLDEYKPCNGVIALQWGYSPAIG